MTPRVRKLALTVHIAASVGWLGAVTGFLALAAVSLTNHDPSTARGTVLAMELMARFVIVPLSFASLASGLAQSLGTRWGLLRHYWIVAKLLINVFANIVLLTYMPTLSYLRAVAAQTNADLSDLRDPSPVLHAGAALMLLLIATVLGVYKPRGMTRYGERKQHEQRLALMP
jgi:hypothetical protein